MSAILIFRDPKGGPNIEVRQTDLGLSNYDGSKVWVTKFSYGDRTGLSRVDAERERAVATAETGRYRMAEDMRFLESQFGIDVSLFVDLVPA